jgi:hypothetical protein
METISNIFELTTLFAMAAWMAAPSARVAWSRATARHPFGDERRAAPSDVSGDGR